MITRRSFYLDTMWPVFLRGEQMSQAPASFESEGLDNVSLLISTQQRCTQIVFQLRSPVGKDGPSDLNDSCDPYDLF